MSFAPVNKRQRRQCAFPRRKHWARYWHQQRPMLCTRWCHPPSPLHAGVRIIYPRLGNLEQQILKFKLLLSIAVKVVTTLFFSVVSQGWYRLHYVTVRQWVPCSSFGDRIVHRNYLPSAHKIALSSYQHKKQQQEYTPLQQCRIQRQLCDTCVHDKCQFRVARSAYTLRIHPELPWT